MELKKINSFIINELKKINNNIYIISNNIDEQNKKITIDININFFVGEIIITCLTNKHLQININGNIEQSFLHSDICFIDEFHYNINQLDKIITDLQIFIHETKEIYNFIKCKNLKKELLKIKIKLLKNNYSLDELDAIGDNLYYLINETVDTVKYVEIFNRYIVFNNILFSNCCEDIEGIYIKSQKQELFFVEYIKNTNKYNIKNLTKNRLLFILNKILKNL